MNVTKGFATWLGTIGAVAAVLIPMIGALADASEPLGVPAQTWAILSAVLATAVVLGRMAQAAVLAAKQPAELPGFDNVEVDSIPSDPHDRPEI